MFRPAASSRAFRRLAGLASPGRGCSSTALVDGQVAPATISLHDLAFLRGDGAFEVVALLPSPQKASVGVPLALEPHLDRLQSTCRSLRMPIAQPLDNLRKWVDEVGKEHGPGSCRLVLTRGNSAQSMPSKCIMLHDPPVTWAESLRLKSIAAPWHLGYSLPPLSAPDAAVNEEPGLWTTIKWTSYSANCLMTRIATEHGADDALLLAADGRVLDGPNFAVGFLIDGRFRLVAPAANRLLPSCTQSLVVQAAQEAGLSLEEGCVHIDEARAATAAFAMSATRHVLPLASIDGHTLDPTAAPLKALQDAYWRLAAKEIASA